MSMQLIMDDGIVNVDEKPGAQLAAARIQQDLSQEYVAGKLHLRLNLIELLESDDYQRLPEPVFVRGYIRAYAKLLDISVEPILEIFERVYQKDSKAQGMLWQSRRETNRAEHAIRWLTGFFAIIVVIAVAVWWYTNKDNERLFSTNISHVETSSNKTETEIRLTDLSKMRSLLSSQNQLENSEKEGG